MCCSVLQCVAVCCSALQCVAVCCNLSGHYKVCSVFLSVFFAHVYFPLSWISLLVGSICHHPTPQQIYIYTAMGLQHTYTQPRDIRTHSHVTTLSLNHLLLLCVCTRVRIWVWMCGCVCARVGVFRVFVFLLGMGGAEWWRKSWMSTWKPVWCLQPSQNDSCHIYGNNFVTCNSLWISHAAHTEPSFWPATRFE